MAQEPWPFSVGPQRIRSGSGRYRSTDARIATDRRPCQALAGRTGLAPHALEVRVFAMSLVGGATEVSLYGAENGFEAGLADLVGRAVDVLEHGLPARTPRRSVRTTGPVRPKSSGSRPAPA